MFPFLTGWNANLCPRAWHSSLIRAGFIENILATSVTLKYFWFISVLLQNVGCETGRLSESVLGLSRLRYDRVSFCPQIPNSCAESADRVCLIRFQIGDLALLLQVQEYLFFLSHCISFPQVIYLPYVRISFPSLLYRANGQRTFLLH